MGDNDDRRQRERDVRVFMAGPPPPPTAGDVAVFAAALAVGIARAFKLRPLRV